MFKKSEDKIPTHSFRFNGSEIRDVCHDLLALLVDVLLDSGHDIGVFQTMQDVVEGTGSMEGGTFPRLQNEGDAALGPTILFLQDLGNHGQLVEIGSLACGDVGEDVAICVIDEDGFVLAHDLILFQFVFQCHPFGDEQNIVRTNLNCKFSFHKHLISILLTHVDG